MAVEILQRGRQAVPYERTCRCGCRFRFLETDAVRRSDQRDGDYLEIACPECNTTNYISARQGYHGPG